MEEEGWLSDGRMRANEPVLRFAPSPNGRLHLGHAYSALLNAHIAERLGGRLLLRIEDIDLGRSRPEFVAGILTDLDWLGLRFEALVRRQSEHFPDYAAARDALAARGLIYPCFCSRGQIAAKVAARAASGEWAPRDPDGAPCIQAPAATCRTTKRRRAASGGAAYLAPRHAGSASFRFRTTRHPPLLTR
ncbi:hypothetical protein GCM10025880_38350 [Methylorubrum aminovorans]|nr:hypothetical protein GCM10025880_38350 [Methylorubrum aminovorans]